MEKLKKNDDIKILPADKGRATVILDSDVYKNKMTKLLSDSNTYMPLKNDPTHKYKSELIEILRTWDKQDLIPKKIHHQIYSTQEEVPKLYGLPKIHKKDTPLRHIVSNVGSITHPAAKYLANIISPLVGHTKNHVQHSSDFANMIKNLEVPPGQKMVSYDVTSLFTSIIVAEAMKTVRAKLESDDFYKNARYLALNRS